VPAQCARDPGPFGLESRRRGGDAALDRNDDGRSAHAAGHAQPGGNLERTRRSGEREGLNAMAKRAHLLFYRATAALAFVLLVSGCTKGGQFDPTEMFNSDVFDSKSKLKGDRVPVFPDGVPGATTGVPPDLVKGYQPPPDQPTDADAAVPGPAPP